MLTEFLVKALAIGGDRIEIEHKERKEWITAFRGCVGCGIGCLDPEDAKTIFNQMDALKKRGEVTVRGVRLRLVFSRYESFGEWVYRIQMKEMRRPRQRRHPHRA